MKDELDTVSLEWITASLAMPPQGEKVMLKDSKGRYGIVQAFRFVNGGWEWWNETGAAYVKPKDQWAFIDIED